MSEKRMDWTGEEYDFVARLEAEAGVELPELHDATLGARARRLLESGARLTEGERLILEGMSS